MGNLLKYYLYLNLFFMYGIINGQILKSNIESIESGDFNSWKQTMVRDEFGDISKTLLLTYVTNGVLQYESGVKKDFSIMIAFWKKDNLLSFDIYDDKHNFVTFKSSWTFIKFMRTDEIKDYVFGDEEKSSFTTPIYEKNGEPVFLLKEILNGSGHKIKFKIKNFKQQKEDRDATFTFEITSFTQSEKNKFRDYF